MVFKHMGLEVEKFLYRKSKIKRNVRTILHVIQFVVMRN